jgi:hypothetical protein
MLSNQTQAAQIPEPTQLPKTDQPTLDTHQAAAYLGVAYVTMRNSRTTGLLCGVRTPPFRKIGRRVVYLRTDLEQWLNDLPAFNNTAEAQLQGAN